MKKEHDIHVQSIQLGEYVHQSSMKKMKGVFLRYDRRTDFLPPWGGEWDRKSDMPASSTSGALFNLTALRTYSEKQNSVAKVGWVECWPQGPVPTETAHSITYGERLMYSFPWKHNFKTFPSLSVNQDLNSGSPGGLKSEILSTRNEGFVQTKAKKSAWKHLHLKHFQRT